MKFQKKSLFVVCQVTKSYSCGIFPALYSRVLARMQDKFMIKIVGINSLKNVTVIKYLSRKATYPNYINELVKKEEVQFGEYVQRFSSEYLIFVVRIKRPNYLLVQMY
jgi:hypothetical protein